jgi:hypothetical protein
MAQDKLPGVRQFCDDRCARRAWAFERAKQRTTVTKALEIAVRKLQASRMPSIRAAATVLTRLHHELTEEAERECAARVNAFFAKLPSTG